MYFNNVDKKYHEAIKALTKDAEFQKRYASDPVLDKLDEEKFDPATCYSELCSTINIPIIIEGQRYPAIKLLQFVYLWCIDSPLAKNNDKEITELDLDVFFYTLEHPITENILSLSTSAIGETRKRGLSIEDGEIVAKTLISFAFQPLRMFPKAQNTIIGNEEPEFDTDWMTAMIGKVHTVTGYTPDYIMNNLSLCACCFYYVQWARMQGAQNIAKRTSEEIIKAQFERTTELVAERLIELGVLKEEDKAQFIEEANTPPAENK